MDDIHVLSIPGFREPFNGLSHLLAAPVLAVLAGVFAILISRQLLPTIPGTITFLVMGWGGAVSCIVLWRRLGFQFVRPLVCGGVVYTLGAIILRSSQPPLIPGFIASHEIWHMAGRTDRISATVHQVAKLASTIR